VVFLFDHLLGAGSLAMGRWWPAALLGCAVAVAVLAAAVECAVTYDKKAVLIDGQRRILFSGSIHYPRSTPDVLHSSKSLLFFPNLPRGGSWLWSAVSAAMLSQKQIAFLL